MPESKPQKKKINRNTYLYGGIAVGVLAYLWWRHRANQAAAASQAIGSTLPTSMPGGAGAASTAVGSTVPAPQSLPEWMALVQRWGNSLGFDAASVQNALQAYSTGACVDPTGYKILDQALSLFGQPPDAPYQGVVLCNTPVPNTTPTPPPPPPPPPPFVNNPPQPPQPPNNPPQPPQPPLPIITPVVTAIRQFFSGSGYGPGNTAPISGNDGSQYQWIDSQSSLSMLPPGIETYYQPQEGMFVQTYPGQGLAPGTPQFFRIGSHPSTRSVTVPAMTSTPDMPVGGVVARVY